MDIIVHLLIFLVVIGIILWLIEFIPMDAAIKQIVRVITIAAVAIYLIVKYLLPFLGSQ